MNGHQRNVGDIMSDLLVCVDPNTPIGRVHELSRERGIHHFPIFGGGSVIGFVCTCDIDGAAPGLPVRDLMRADVVTVQRRASTAEAARLLVQRAVGSAVVLDRDVPCGIVTRTDLAREGAELDEILGECHCATCGSLEHLKLDRYGRQLCQDCRERAEAEASLDLGGGD